MPTQSEQRYPCPTTRDLPTTDVLTSFLADTDQRDPSVNRLWPTVERGLPYRFTKGYPANCGPTRKLPNSVVDDYCDRNIMWALLDRQFMGQMRIPYYY